MNNLDIFWVVFIVLMVVGFIVNVYDQIRIFKEITVGDVIACLLGFLVGVIRIVTITFDYIIDKLPKIVIYKKDK